ncbi:MAG: CPBP family intramembrane metalloprotease [Candidatus Lokiarchaeota archaeon]|nr:CPBP family intramembrane metalloprotease [Candidatus Lokiarchaeota archaeon]
MKENDREKNKVYELQLFILFLMCGLLVFFVPIFIQDIIRIIYFIVVSSLFLIVSILSYRNTQRNEFYPVFFAFFIASLVFYLQMPWTSGTTIENIVYNILISTLIIVVPIILLTKISKNDISSIFLQKGNIRLGLIIGLATFSIFLITALPTSVYLFGGQNISFDRLISLFPWILIFVFLNGIREEILFRGLFLKKYDKFLGVDSSNILQAIIFSLAHLSSQFTLFSFIYFALTFFLGLGFGAVIQKTDSLLGAILFHAGADIPVIIAVFSVL